MKIICVLFLKEKKNSADYLAVLNEIKSVTELKKVSFVEYNKGERKLIAIERIPNLFDQRYDAFMLSDIKPTMDNKKIFAVFGEKVDKEIPPPYLLYNMQDGSITITPETFFTLRRGRGVCIIDNVKKISDLDPNNVLMGDWRYAEIKDKVMITTDGWIQLQPTE